MSSPSQTRFRPLRGRVGSHVLDKYGFAGFDGLSYLPLAGVLDSSFVAAAAENWRAKIAAEPAYFCLLRNFLFDVSYQF
jgi:hypothetical protein